MILRKVLPIIFCIHKTGHNLLGFFVVYMTWEYMASKLFMKYGIVYCLFVLNWTFSAWNINNIFLLQMFLSCIWKHVCVCLVFSVSLYNFEQELGPYIIYFIHFYHIFTINHYYITSGAGLAANYHLYI